MPPKPEDVERLSQACERFVFEAARGMTDRFDTIRYRMLKSLAEQGELRPSDLAAQLDVNPSSVTRQVAALQREGLIETSAHSEDARAVKLRVTRQGRAEIRRTASAGARAFAAVIADWSTEEVRTLNRLIDKLIASWSKGGHK